MSDIFEAEGFDVVVAHDGIAGLAAIERENPDVVALDIELPGLTGIQILERLGDRLASLPIVMLTAHRDVKHAVHAMQLGAYHYLTKPIDTAEVVLVFNRAVERRQLHEEVQQLRRRVEGNTLAEQMGSSPEITDVFEQVRTVAASDFTVLVLGETGSGKELIAQALHRQSGRAAAPFIALDCGAIPETLLESELFGHEKGAFSGAERKKEGQFQLAERGTLFLDEIGNMPINLQAKLLRALESKQVQAVGATRLTPLDVRFIAATNIDLERKIQAGEFRADLFFRLAQYTIRLPALRERPGDIRHLARRFVREVSIELRRPVTDITEEALVLLVAQSWPGNVRELRNVVRQAVLRCRVGSLDAESIVAAMGKSAEAKPLEPAPAAGDRSLKSLKEVAVEAAQQAERIAIREALRAAGGNKALAARTLRTDYKTMHVKMKQLGIENDA